MDQNGSVWVNRPSFSGSRMAQSDRCCRKTVLGVLGLPKPVKHIITSGIACMNCGALPVPVVHFDVVGHVNSM
jgi:hypothetical protein